MSTFAAQLCAWLASFKIEGIGRLWMDITDYDDLRCFCFFLSLVWFCLLLLMQGAGLLNSWLLGIGILDVRSSIVGENGCNAIGFTSALQGRQQYMEEVKMV
jgi:hypothetical protein